MFKLLLEFFFRQLLRVNEIRADTSTYKNQEMKRFTFSMKNTESVNIMWSKSKVLCYKDTKRNSVKEIRKSQTLNDSRNTGKSATKKI